jgi:tetratricopeptide (TPR) repeat protein
VLEKLLKKDPAERYHRADQVIRDLNWSGTRHYPLETEATALAYLPGEGRLVGREEEWSMLVSYFDRVFLTRSENKICVTLTGPPGTGKTRLLKELKYHAQLQTVSVLDLSKASPADLKSDCLLIADDASPESLETAELWMRQFQTRSFMIVLAGRNLSISPGTGFQLELKNFDRPTVASYVASVLGMTDVPPFLSEELHARTEGNPLLLTELLQSLLQSHQIFDSQGRWSASLLKEVGIDFNKLKVPRTIEEYCESKFKNLSTKGQKLLSIVAISKAPLDRALLPSLGLEINPEEWRTLEIENLIDLDRIWEVKLFNPSFREWISKNIPASTLASLHQGLGELFQKETDTQDAACYHLGLGEGNREERFQYLIQYGEFLLQRYRWLDAARAFEEATSFAPSPEKEVEGSLNRVRALFRARLNTEGLQVLEQTQSLLKKERDKSGQWRWIQQTFREMGNIYLKEGRLDLARESLKASQVLLEEHEENTVEEMILENFRASLLLRAGNLQEAYRISEENHRRWEELPLDKKKQVLNNELPSLLLYLNKKEEAKAFFIEQNSFLEKIGNKAKRADALYGWAESAYSLKEFEEAIQKYQECVDLSREIKNEELLFHAFNGLGNIAYVQSDYEAAIRYYQNALELAQHYGDVDSSVGIAINLSLVFRLQGDLGSAQLTLKHVVDTLEALSPLSYTQLHFLTQAYLEAGLIHREHFKWIEARDAYRDAIRLVRNHPILERFRFSSLLGLAQTAPALERDSEAQTVFKELEKGNLTEAENEELEKIKGVPEAPIKPEKVRRK